MSNSRAEAESADNKASNNQEERKVEEDTQPTQKPTVPKTPEENASSTEIEHSKSEETNKKSSTPTLAIVFLVVSLSSIAASLVVVYVANGRTVLGWIPRAPAVQPAVLVALFTGIFSFSQKLVFSAGVSVMWWRAFSQNASLANLHYIWNRGSPNGVKDIWRAFNESAQTKWVLLVLVIMTVVDIADGPLLQRSIRPVMKIFVEEYDAIGRLNPKIQDGWAGVVDNTAPAKLLGNLNLDDLLADRFRNVSISGDVQSCVDAICTGPLTGAGIAVNCSSEEQFLDLTAPENTNATVFSVDFNRTVDNAGTPILTMAYSFMSGDDGYCNATIGITACTFRTATVVYDVIEENQSLRLLRERAPAVVSHEPSLGDLPAPDGTLAGPLAALEYFGYYYLRSNATLTPRTPDGSYPLEPFGDMVKLYWITADSFGGQWNQSCPFAWKNATSDLVWDLHDVMFRMAAWNSSGDETSVARWTSTSQWLAYETELISLWVASGMMLLSVFTAMTLFWGFWNLGRKVSLSPLETGRALADTIMSDSAGDPNMDIDEIIEVMGDKKVPRQ